MAVRGQVVERSRVDDARVAELGFCPPCYASGQAVLVAPGAERCRAHLATPTLVETSRSGQTRLAVPVGARRRPTYPTGLQVACVKCAAVGVDRQGLPRDGADSDPLCVPCWRGRTERQAAQERRRLVAELREDLDVDDVPAGCLVCGSVDPSLECWLCGWSHLAAARAEHEREQAARAAAEAEQYERIVAVTEAEARVDELVAWIDRLRATVDGYATGAGQGRAVELVADLLARDAAARTSRRGRPGALARVGAVLAVAADYRTGRHALPGRDRSAELAGCTVRAVTSAWARGEALGWSTRTRQGRRLTLAERKELGRWNDRAEFDLAPLHRGDVAGRAAYVPAALAVLADLLEHAAGLLTEAQAALDGLRARSGSWTDRPETVQRREHHRAVAASVGQVRDQARTEPSNYFPPSSGSLGENLSSCSYRGLLFSPPITFRAKGGPGRPSGRRMNGASRSSTEGVDGRDRRGAGRSRGGCPRPAQRSRAGSPRPRPRPEWADWAYPFARALRTHWRWLAEVPLPRIAATLGAALGPDWTAETLIRWVARQRRLSLLADPRDPVAYLRAVLVEVLTGRAEPPAPAARHTAHRRAEVAIEVDVLRAAQDATRAAQDTRDAVAVPGRANAAIRALRARWAERAAAAAPAEEAWPAVAQPGSGGHAPK